MKRKLKVPRKAETYRGARRNEARKLVRTTPGLTFAEAWNSFRMLTETKVRTHRRRGKTYQPNGTREVARRLRRLDQ
jgi:hypothetical protein